KGFRYSDVAVMLRMTSQSLPLQIALLLEEIPYHCRREENIVVSDLMKQLVKDATPLEFVGRIAEHFKHMGGIVGSRDDAINNTLPLGELVDIAGRFKGDVPQFHALLSGLVGKAEGGLYHDEERDAVNLQPYFRAKGRQWNTVIIPGTNQTVIPLRNGN